jgi:hypothetical protein
MQSLFFFFFFFFSSSSSSSSFSLFIDNAFFLFLFSFFEKNIASFLSYKQKKQNSIFIEKNKI